MVILWMDTMLLFRLEPLVCLVVTPGGLEEAPFQFPLKVILSLFVVLMGLGLILRPIGPATMMGTMEETPSYILNLIIMTNIQLQIHPRMTVLCVIVKHWSFDGLLRLLEQR